MFTQPSSQLPSSTTALCKEFQEAIQLSEEGDPEKACNIVKRFFPILNVVFFSENENKLFKKIVAITDKYFLEKHLSSPLLLHYFQKTTDLSINKKYSPETIKLLDLYKSVDFHINVDEISETCSEELFDFAKSQGDLVLTKHLMKGAGCPQQ